MGGWVGGWVGRYVGTHVQLLSYLPHTSVVWALPPPCPWRARGVSLQAHPIPVNEQPTHRRQPYLLDINTTCLFSPHLSAGRPGRCRYTRPRPHPCVSGSPPPFCTNRSAAWRAGARRLQQKKNLPYLTIHIQTYKHTTLHLSSAPTTAIGAKNSTSYPAYRLRLTLT